MRILASPFAGAAGLVAAVGVVVSGGPRLEAQRAPAKAAARPAVDPRLDALRKEALAEVQSMQVFTQQMVDSIFSFGELGFQELETHRYLVDILRTNGFTVEEGIAGIPTAFMATWGSGKPVAFT